MPKFQAVQLTFSDGSTAIFTGPVAVDDEHPRGGRVVGVKFFAPQELPEDCYFEDLGKSDAHH